MIYKFSFSINFSSYYLTLKQGRGSVVVHGEAAEAVRDTIDCGPLGGQFLREDRDEVLLLEVGPLGEPGQQVVHLLVVGQLRPLVTDPPLQHPWFTWCTGQTITHVVVTHSVSFVFCLIIPFDINIQVQDVLFCVTMDRRQSHYSPTPPVASHRKNNECRMKFDMIKLCFSVATKCKSTQHFTFNGSNNRFVGTAETWTSIINLQYFWII